MSTYQNLQDRIADELKRADLTSQIALEIQSAIAYYQGTRFYFNERRDVTFNTVASQEFYTSSDIANLTLIQEFDAVTVTVNGNRFHVRHFPYQELEISSVTTTTLGEPNYYSFYAQQLRLYPIPQQVYAVRISGLFQVAAPSAGSDSNAWTNDAEELIRASAKKRVCLNYLLDTDQAAIYKGIETDILRNLEDVTVQMTASSRLVGSL
jgi:hypothetical protein